MAVRLAKATGNLLDANGWNAAETGASSQQLTRSSSTASTTSYVYNGTAFTIGNTDVIDGVLLFLRRNGITGTIDIALSADSGTTPTISVTVNASDLPVNSGWVFFKFTSTLIGSGAATYKVGVRHSGGGSGVTTSRSGTAADWARIFRTTATATIGAADVMYVFKELTGAGAATAITYTMDSVSTATQYGTGTDGVADNGIEICFGGTMSYGIAGSTNYALKLGGSVNIWDSGVLNIGSSGAEIPRTSTAVLEINCTAAGGNRILINDGGTLNTYGLSRTSGKNVTHCLLTADAAANATSLSVDTETGWLDNDEVAVFATTRTGTQSEKGTLNGNAGASSLTVDGFAGTAGGVLNAHGGGGTTNVIAEVILVTRNVTIQSTSAANPSNFIASALATVSLSWMAMNKMGSGTTSNAGLTVQVTTGNFSAVYCCIKDNHNSSAFSTRSISITSSSGNNFTVQHCTGWNIATFIVVAQTSAVHVVDSNYMYHGASGATYTANTFNDVGLTLTDNHFCQSSSTSTNSVILTGEPAIHGTWNGNVIHSGNGRGYNLSGGSGECMNDSSWKIWRQGNVGIYLSGDQGSPTVTSQFTSFTVFGNTTNQINNAGFHCYGILAFVTCTFYSESGFTTTSCFDCNFTTLQGMKILFIDCAMDSGGTNHTNCVRFPVSNNGFGYIQLIRSTYSQGSAITTAANMDRVTVTVHDVANSKFILYNKNGTITGQTATRHTASGYAWQMTPLSASVKLTLPGETTTPIKPTFRAVVSSGVSTTITMWLRKDGTYNGNAPRLVVVGGLVAGVGSWGTDVTNALTVGVNTWEQLSVNFTPSEDGVVEFYADCDGTAGNAFADDVAVA